MWWRFESTFCFGVKQSSRRIQHPGLRFNIKMTSYQYRKSHCGDKTILRPSYLHNGISYTGKMASLYWIRALMNMHSFRVLLCFVISQFYTMTSSNGNIFRVIGLLCGEFTGPRGIPRTKASDTGLWCFLWSVPEQTAEQTIETPVIWDAVVLIMTSL